MNNSYTKILQVLLSVGLAIVMMPGAYANASPTVELVEFSQEDAATQSLYIALQNGDEVGPGMDIPNLTISLDGNPLYTAGECASGVICELPSGLQTAYYYHLKMTFPSIQSSAPRVEISTLTIDYDNYVPAKPTALALTAQELRPDSTNNVWSAPLTLRAQYDDTDGVESTFAKIQFATDEEFTDIVAGSGRDLVIGETTCGSLECGAFGSNVLDVDPVAPGEVITAVTKGFDLYSTMDSLLKGTTYYVRMSVRDDAGAWSLYSEPVEMIWNPLRAGPLQYAPCTSVLCDIGSIPASAHAELMFGHSTINTCEENPGGLQVVTKLPGDVQIMPGDFLEMRVTVPNPNSFALPYDIHDFSGEVLSGDGVYTFTTADYLTNNGRTKTLQFLTANNQSDEDVFVMRLRLSKIYKEGDYTLGARLMRPTLQSNGGLEYTEVWSATDAEPVVVQQGGQSGPGPYVACDAPFAPIGNQTASPATIRKAAFLKNESTDSLRLEILDPDTNVGGSGLGGPSYSTGIDFDSFTLYLDDALVYADGECKEGYICDLEEDFNVLNVNVERLTPSVEATARIRVGLRNNRNFFKWYDNTTPEPIVWETAANQRVDALPFTFRALYADNETHRGNILFAEVASDQGFDTVIASRKIQSSQRCSNGTTPHPWMGCIGSSLVSFVFSLVSGEGFDVAFEESWFSPQVEGGGGGVVIIGGGSVVDTLLTPGQTYYIRARIQDTFNGQSTYSQALPFIWKEAPPVVRSSGGGGGFSGGTTSTVTNELVDGQQLTTEKDQKTQEGESETETTLRGVVPDLTPLNLRPSANVFASLFMQSPLLQKISESISLYEVPNTKIELEELPTCARADAVENMLRGMRSSAVLTRGQMAAVLYLRWCESVEVRTTTVSSFSDVRSGTDMARVTSFLRTLGVLRGDGKSEFRAEETARIGEGFALALRQSNIQTADSLSALQADPWYMPFQVYAQKMGWTFIDKDFGGELTLGDFERMLEVMGV